MIGLAGSVVAAPAVADEPATGLTWGACPADVVTKVAVLQCATVPVPLDYRDPEGARIEIMVSRLTSKKPDKRRGVLMLNPGGPGGSGLSFADDLAWFGIPASVLDSYDVIGMDTRGIGHSAPVSCGFTADQGYLGNIPPYAVDEAAVAEQAKSAKAVAEWPSEVRTYQRAVAEDRERYPLYGAASANVLPCAFWPHEPAEPPVPVVDEGPANVLVVQNQRDPVTPLRGGELIDEKFGERSRLVSVDSSGHGVYVTGDNACALNTTTSFLVDGKLPERDKTCA
jgi:hypothetical protein